MTEPVLEKIRALDVVPNLWAVWCTVEGNGSPSLPFANTIVLVRWSEDREHLRFMLDTHNFMKAHPDEVLELVRCAPDKYMPECRIAELKEKHAKFVAARWTPREVKLQRALLAAKTLIEEALKETKEEEDPFT